MIYNDSSVLENMHVAKLYTVLKNEDSNMFSTLNDDQWRHAWKTIVGAVLATDMCHHFPMVEDVRQFYDKHKEASFYTHNRSC